MPFEPLSACCLLAVKSLKLNESGWFELEDWLVDEDAIKVAVAMAIWIKYDWIKLNLT